MSIEQVRDFLGHTHLKSTQVYTRVGRKHMDLDLKSYLFGKYSPQTIKVYLLNISRYLQYIGAEKGIIYVRAMIRTTARTLTLKPNQVMLFYEYIQKVRPELLKTETNKLVLTLRGAPESGEGVTNLLKEGKNLRMVQVFAGHKKSSTTEKYRQSGLEELQVAIDKHHPLGVRWYVFRVK